MNGISSSLKDELKKTNDTKLKAKIKFATAIVGSNLLVALLCLPSTKALPPTQAAVIVKTQHIGHKMMVLPIQLLLSDEDLKKTETIITLVSSDKKVIVPKAFLHEEIPQKSSGESFQNEDQKHFKIEIPDSDLVKISDFIEKGVIALPYVLVKTAKTIKRGSNYEVSF